ncbi:MAG: DUF6591 domain-containing protein [Oscillospiraceae bacterium]
MVSGAQPPQPPAKKSGQIHVRTDTADELWVDIEKTSGQAVCGLCAGVSDGWVHGGCGSPILVVQRYNAEGYKPAAYYEIGRELSIRLESRQRWASHHLAGQRGRRRQLPAPKSLTGKFSFEYDDNFFVYIGGTSRDDYNAYAPAPAGIRALRSTTIRATTIIVPITTRGGMSRSIMWATRS